MIKLRKLLLTLPHAEVRGPKDITVSGLSNHSKAVAPGHLFVAKAGTYDHGGRYIMEALRGGASAILTDLCDPSLKGVTQIIVPDVVGAENRCAAAFYGDPSQELTVFGVTGTNGKSTVTCLIQQLWSALRQEPCGLLGTILYDLGRERIPASHTTPDAITTQKLLREMRTQGCSAVAMEVSSHALDQRRCEAVAIDVGIFTNLTQDHLDYHGSMERYAQAKGKLFRMLAESSTPAAPRQAIAFGEDPWIQQVVGTGPFQLTTFGWGPQNTLCARDLVLSCQGTRFTLQAPEGSREVSIPLLGRHNVLNVLAASAALRSVGYNLDQIVESFHSLKAPSGRLEPVENGLGIQILVDYAHTPDALTQACSTLKELTNGRLLVVFGAGGNRDRTKRPKMAQAVQQIADGAIITSDNPRFEEPQTIAEDIVAGLEGSFPFEVELDRAAAIERAIALAQPGDVVLIAGKGHESSQQIGNHVLPFQDQSIAAEACQRVLQQRMADCLTQGQCP